MARLSGLASEHHPEGPGDAPRRKRARKSKTPSVDLTNANKRAASPTVEASQPKRKRVQVDDHEQLMHELEKSVSRSQEDDAIHLAHEEKTRHSRRHSEPVVIAQDEEDDSQRTSTPPPATQPPSGLTPHLTRLGAPRGRPSNARRARMSMPAQLQLEAVDEKIDDKEVQFAPLTAVLDGRTRRRLRRSHLSEEVNEIEEHHKDDKKIRKAYTDLLRQLREKDAAISDLNYQLEAHRLGNMLLDDDRAEELEQQLAQAQKEIEELRASSLYAGDSREQSAFESNADGLGDDEDHGLMLIDPEDLDMQHEDLDAEPLPNGEYAARALAMSSQVTVNSLTTITQTSHDSLADVSQTDPTSVPDKISDQAVKRYDAEIDRLIKQLGESQGALRVIAVELQNLHVVAPGASSDVIVQKLRHGFETVREELENLIPRCTVGLTNSELLHKIPDLFEGMLKELREKTVLSETHWKNERMLRTQYEKVLDLLATSEDRNEELDKKLYDLDRANEEKQRNIVDLEEQVTTVTTLANDQDAEIKQKDAQVHALEDELDDKETALDRLRASLETYRQDLNTVTATSTRLEEEHRQTIADMEQAHADAIQDLENQLGAESEAREAAEGDVQQKSDYIDQLEGDIQRLESEAEAIIAEIAQLSDRLTAETAARETAEGERDDQIALVYDHSNTIENLNETLQDLEAQIAEFRSNLEAERNQREQTEASLDEANEQIADLNDRVRDAGLQANELRSKLFQVQQEKQEAINRLEEEAQDRETEHQELLDAERQHRLDAEEDVSSLEAQVSQLEKNITDLEDEITRLTNQRHKVEMDRDNQIASLNAQLADLSQKYAALENSSNSTITSLHANITDLNNQVHAQQAEIERITFEAEETERNLREEVTDKTEEIVGLKEDLLDAHADNEKLAGENRSLAKRVEDEASELLNIMGAHAQEANALRSVIATQSATIDSLQATAAQRATEHEAEVTEKTQQIEELQVMGDTRAEVIVALEAQLADIKERFRVQEEDTRNTIDLLTDSQRKLQEQNEQLAATLKKRNADALKAVQEMKVKGVEIKTTGANLHKVTNAKITKVSERVKVGKKGSKKKVAKRQWDSGIGVDENFENDIDEVDAEALAI